MKSNSTTQGSLAASALFGLCLLVMRPTAIGRSFLFPYERLAVLDASHRWHYFLSSSQATGLNLLQWGIVTAVFGWLARKVRMEQLFPLTLVVIGLATVTMHVVVRTLGMGFYWNLCH